MGFEFCSYKIFFFEEAKMEYINKLGDVSKA